MGQAVLSREELGKELAELEKQLEACCTLCADSIQTVVSSACSLRVEGRERIEKVMERLQSLETEDSYVQTVRENQEEELHKFKQQMSETQASLDYLHKHNSLLLQKKENREKLISTLMADVTSKMSSKKQKVAALHEATTWYKQLLSMHCEYSDAVKFIFTNVEPQDPDRVFSFSVRHDKATNLWAIVECNPRVEASANLVEALNQSNEFSWFVRSMHREFEGRKSLESCEILVSGSPTTLAVVKRANQGTGLEIVHQLAEESNSIVLTACNTMCDIEATRSLKKQHRGLNRGCGWTCFFYTVGNN